MSFHLEGDSHQANGQELELFPRWLERKSKYKLLHWLLGNIRLPLKLLQPAPMDSVLKTASFGLLPSVSLLSRNRHSFCRTCLQSSGPASENKVERGNSKIILVGHRQLVHFFFLESHRFKIKRKMQLKKSRKNQERGQRPPSTIPSTIPFFRSQIQVRDANLRISFI